MKSIDPSDAFNSLALSLPDYNKTKQKMSHFTCHFTNKLYEKKNIPIILLFDVSCPRDQFFLKTFTFFHKMGTIINSSFSTFIHVGWKEMFVVQL